MSKTRFKSTKIGPKKNTITRILELLTALLSFGSVRLATNICDSEVTTQLNEKNLQNFLVVISDHNDGLLLQKTSSFGHLNDRYNIIKAH